MQPIARIIVLGILCAFALLVSSAYAAAPDIRDLNLRLADMPPGFITAGDTLVDNVAAAKEDHVSVAREVRSGRVLSDERAFVWPHSQPRGLFVARGIVVQYDSPAHARAAYVQGVSAGADHATSSVDSWRGFVVANHEIRSPAFERVGAQRTIWTWATAIPLAGRMGQHHSRVVSTVDSCFFYRGHYVVTIVTLNLTTHDLTQLAQFALAVDERIKHAT